MSSSAPVSHRLVRKRRRHRSFNEDIESFFCSFTFRLVPSPIIVVLSSNYLYPSSSRIFWLPISGPVTRSCALSLQYTYSRYQQCMGNRWRIRTMLESQSLKLSTELDGQYQLQRVSLLSTHANFCEKSTEVRKRKHVHTSS